MRTGGARGQAYWRDLVLLLRPRATLRLLCPLLGRTLAPRILLPQQKVSYGGLNDTSEDHRLRIVNASAAVAPYIEEDLRLLAKALQPELARLHGYRLPRAARAGGRLRR